MIRVLHVICFSELYGTQKSAFSTIKCLDRSRFEPFVAAPPDEAFERAAAAAGARFLPVPMRGLFDLASAKQLQSVISELNIDLLHCHLGISTFLGLLAARKTRTPVVVSRHFIKDRYTTISNPLVYKAYLEMYRWMNRRIACTICVSAAVRDAIAARETLPPDKCAVVHNGVSLDGFGASSGPESDPPLYQGRPVVVTLSRLVHEKGLETLIRATALCRGAGGSEPAVVVIAGSGPLEGELVRLTRELGLEQSVVFAGFVHDPRALLASADVFVLPALDEPFGIALIEAMAAGTPSIATASGGPLEIITDEKTGLLVPPSDPEALASAMKRLLSDPALASRLVKNAREDVQRFDEHEVTKKVEKIYARAVAETIHGKHHD